MEWYSPKCYERSMTLVEMECYIGVLELEGDQNQSCEGWPYWGNIEGVRGEAEVMDVVQLILFTLLLQVDLSIHFTF